MVLIAAFRKSITNNYPTQVTTDLLQNHFISQQRRFDDIYQNYCWYLLKQKPIGTADYAELAPALEPVQIPASMAAAWMTHQRFSSTEHVSHWVHLVVGHFLQHHHPVGGWRRTERRDWIILHCLKTKKIVRNLRVFRLSYLRYRTWRRNRLVRSKVEGNLPFWAWYPIVMVWCYVIWLIFKTSNHQKKMILQYNMHWDLYKTHFNKAIRLSL